jgi:hypothetical protein
MASPIGILSVEVPAMTDDQIKEQIGRGKNDAQLLILVDRNQARVLLLQYQVANPSWGFTEHPGTTPQEVCDDAFFKKLEERLTLCC